MECEYVEASFLASLVSCWIITLSSSGQEGSFLYSPNLQNPLLTRTSVPGGTPTKDTGAQETIERVYASAHACLSCLSVLLALSHERTNGLHMLLSPYLVPLQAQRASS